MIEIAKLQLEPGDVLVVRAPRPIPYSSAVCIQRDVEDRLKKAGLENQVLILEPGWELQKILKAL